jgi:hypothetical protein
MRAAGVAHKPRVIERRHELHCRGERTTVAVDRRALISSEPPVQKEMEAVDTVGVITQAAARMVRQPLNFAHSKDELP